MPAIPEESAYTAVPANLTLEQVHVYVRHGERAPVGVRLNKAPASIPENWLLCHAARRFAASVWDPASGGIDRESDTTLDVRRVVERRDGTAHPGECMLGELTDVGRQSTYKYGEGLRNLFIDKLGFLPDSMASNDTTYFRSTNLPRTIESLQQIMHGLYPDHKYAPGITPQLLVRNGKDENLVANLFSCRRLERMSVSFAQAAAEAINPTLSTLDRKLSRYIDGKHIRIDGKPRASGILDTVRAAKAHGYHVPKEFNDPKVMDLLEYAVVTEWFGGYQNHEYRRLAMGPLLDDLQRKMQRKVEMGERDPLKLLVHSTHDTAIAGILATLDVFDNRWPDFTASVTFDLFKKSPPQPPKGFMSAIYGTMSPFRKMEPTEYFVRVRYQNKNLQLPLCAAEGRHLSGSPEFCTLSAFQARVKDLTPADWAEECRPPKPAGSFAE